jgi:lipopolysaccharide export system protein LptC
LNSVTFPDQLLAYPALSAERRRAFAVAARHSRRVRRLRVALPAAGLVLALLVIGWSVVTRIEIGLAIGDLRLTAEGLAMDAPRLSGSDGKGRTYEVTAASAVQDLANPKVIRLSGIAAHVRQADGSTADFAAASGVYDAGAQTLVLQEHITIRASDGSAADLTRAEIDLATGEVTSDAPVAFSSSLGSIEAEQMEVGDKGKSVTFGGGVKMTVNPNAVENADALKGDLLGGGEKDPTP